MLQWRLYNGGDLPAGLEGFVKAAANIGSVIGQFTFGAHLFVSRHSLESSCCISGYLADSLGRKAVYGKELMIIIVATIFCISDPTGDISPNGVLVWLGVFRILLGVGVGGDYPMSASVMTDRALIRKRGALLAYVFANQGWGSLVGSIVTMIVLQCYKHVMNTDGETSKVDGAWRIIIGISLVPAFGTLYQRLTLAESRRFKASRQMEEEEDASIIEQLALKDQSLKLASKEGDDAKTVSPTSTTDPNAAGAPTGPQPVIDQEPGLGAKETVLRRKAHFREFLVYFSEWRHAKILIGTCTCWFFLDIA